MSGCFGELDKKGGLKGHVQYLHLNLLMLLCVFAVKEEARSGRPAQAPVLYVSPQLTTGPDRSVPDSVTYSDSLRVLLWRCCRVSHRHGELFTCSECRPSLRQLALTTA
ncbi:hypothetical protein AOLI_G00118400 [Acnodon oligacanthus]